MQAAANPPIPPVPQSLREVASPRLRLLLPILVFVAALALRLVGLGQNPHRHATDDEFHYLWAGMSLLETGVPTSWSRLAGAREAWVGRIDWQGSHLQIVRPALDHPPLFSLLAGIAGKLSGAQPMQLRSVEGRTQKLWDVDLGRVRLLPVLLFAVTFWSLFLLVYTAYGYPVAVVSTLLYGFIAHIVIHNRLLVADNLIAPLFVLSLCVTQLYLKGTLSRRNFGFFVTAALAAAVLSKLPALSCVLAVAAMLLAGGKLRDVVFPLGGAAIGAALYVLYGALEGWSTFISVLLTHSNRFSGFDSLQGLILTQPLVGNDSSSPLLFYGWLGAFALLLSERQNPLMAAFLAYLVGFIFLTPSNAIYGWYALPIYPFLCIGLGQMIVLSWRKPRTLVGCTTLLLLVCYAFQVGIHMAPQELTLLRIAFAIVAVSLLLLANVWRLAAARYMRVALACALIISCVGEVLALYGASID